MRRTKFLSVIILGILLIDLISGIMYTHTNKFLDSNGDNYEIINVCNILFGPQRVSKAIIRIEREKLISHDAIIKNFADFALNVDEKISDIIINDYIDKIDYEINVNEYSLDPKILNENINILLESQASQNSKKTFLSLNKIHKYRVFLIPHKYSDIIFDEVQSNKFNIFNRCLVVCLKYQLSDYIDEINTSGFVKMYNNNVNISRFSYGDLITLVDDLTKQCRIDMDSNKSVILNLSDTISDIMWGNRYRTIMHGQNDSYVLSIYPSSIARFQIDRSLSASHSVYCFCINKSLNDFNGIDKYIERFKDQCHNFSDIGTIVFKDKLLSMNLVSNIFPLSTSIENGYLVSILTAIDINAFNKRCGQDMCIITTRGVLFLKYEDLDENEVDQAYIELVAKSQTCKNTNKKINIKRSSKFQIPPFIGKYDEFFNKQFGFDINDLLPNTYISIVDYYNNRFITVTLNKNILRKKYKYPGYSSIKIALAETLE